MAGPDLSHRMDEIRRHRSKWADAPRPAVIEPKGPGDESVWDFPRPPRVEDAGEPLRVRFADTIVAETKRGLRILETAGAPVYFFPPPDVEDRFLQPVRDHWTLCEWKGAATYFDLVVGDRRSAQAAFCYPDPLDDLGQGFNRVAGWIAFNAARVDAAYIGEEQVRPQPGGYYAGWVTSRLKGPIKGAPGSEGW